ncbi:Hypothetical Protein FCC1311_088602 [Hondaea fermentalgiana]|uniref:Uncharacterized protein n=1 Tax=Hondaea fermentalgiana TaxID=2315210 RepID=A0A2R5GPV1_9STRA|nr:Hypothetical Protein FCC1311_088602 [Hondaea fermentalgiana]|eukprot:GBG32635.1 Hypothetical Protein FCC1311_088602 [Hondaea fermentalgiana]
MAAPSQLPADEAATRVAEGAANADGDDDRVIEALFEELGLDARQEVAQNMDHGSSLDGYLQDSQTDNVASEYPIIESNHENDNVDIVVEDDGNKDGNEDNIDNVEEEGDDDDNDEDFERQMNEILAIGDDSLSTELSEPTCYRLQTPKPINLYFRIADEKYAAIRSHSSGANRGQIAKLASASQGVFGAAMGNLTMGAWVGQLVPTELLSSDLRLEASDSGARVRERLDKMVSTYVNVVDVYLGAQLKVLLHVRVETVIGGALWALSHASPCVFDTKDFANWRQSRLLRFFSSRKSSGEPISFVAVALPGAQAARIDAALHQTVDLFRPYLDQNHEKQSRQSQRTGMSEGKVLSTLHSNLGLDVVRVMRSIPKDRDPALRAAIEDAAAGGVTNLCIPLRDWILEEEALRTEDSEANNGKFTRTRLGKAEVEQLVRVVRASLLSLAHRNIMGKLREVTFLLKSSCADASLARGDAEVRARKVFCEQDGLIVSKAMTLIKATFDAT